MIRIIYNIIDVKTKYKYLMMVLFLNNSFTSLCIQKFKKYKCNFNIYELNMSRIHCATHI